MRALHIVQGDQTGDKAFLQKAATRGLNASRWVVPKSVAIEDDVVIYVGGYGFFATCRINSAPSPHPNRPNRYAAGVTAIKLIEPPISLGAIRRHLPDLAWAEYPRSITTPTPELADQIRTFVQERRKSGLPDLDDAALSMATLEELRAVALAKARPSVPRTQRMTIHRARSRAIHLYVLLRADGRCEGCDAPAPFLKTDDSPYLEPHHTTRVADEGPDHPAHVIALCPNCHCRAHHAKDATTFNASLKKRLERLEPGS